MQEQDPAGWRPAGLPAEASLRSWLTVFVCSTHRPTCTTHHFLMCLCFTHACLPRPSATSSYHSKRTPNNPAAEDHRAPLCRARRVSLSVTLGRNVAPFFFWKRATLHFAPKNCHHIVGISAVTPYLPGTVRHDWLLSSSLRSRLEFRALKDSRSLRENLVYFCLHSTYYICSVLFPSLQGSGQKKITQGDIYFSNLLFFF